MNHAYVISDLHLGGGDKLDSFKPKDDESFCAWIDEIAPSAPTLFLNGDFVDFIRIDATIAPGVPRHLLWGEDDSRRKLARAVAAHPTCFAALARLLEDGGQIHVVTGNHDLDFDWDGVRDDFRIAVSGDDRNVAFTTGSVLHEGVHIEHGYAFTPENCPTDPVDFRIEHDGEVLLERVWGTDLVISYLNGVQDQVPFAYQVKPALRLLWWGLKKHWIPRRQLLKLVAFLATRDIPLSAVGSMMAGEETDAVQGLGQAFISEEEWRGLVTELVNDASEQDPADPDTLAAALAELSPEERSIIATAASVDGELDDEQLAFDPADPNLTMGVFRPGREVRAAQDRLDREGVTHVVFGHTHHVIDGGEGGRHFNPGTWNPKLHLGDPAVVARLERDGITEAVLNDRDLYRTDRRAVHIATGDEGTVVELLAIP